MIYSDCRVVLQNEEGGQGMYQVKIDTGTAIFWMGQREYFIERSDASSWKTLRGAQKAIENFKKWNYEYGDEYTIVSVS